MTKIDALKRDMEMMRDLENLTSMLEQTAARTIAQMRSDILSSRAYFREVWRIYGVLKQLVPPAPEVVHKHLVVGIGIDWGMPGGLLNHVMDKVVSEQKAHEADMLIAGKMSHSRFKGESDHTIHYFSSPKNATLANIQPIYKVIAGYAKVTIVYPSFVSLSKQSILTASFSVGNADNKEPENDRVKNAPKVIDPSRFIIDPDPQTLANYLSEAIVGLTVHHYFTESILAYSAAQMVAMRNSHDNAKQEGRHLFIRYNKARREEIDAKIRELYGSRTERSASARNEEEGA